MMKNNKCDTCARSIQTHEPVDYYTHENLRAQMMEVNRRWFIFALIVFILFVGTNIFWIVRERQFDVTTEETTFDVVQDSSDNGRNLVIGGDYNGDTESSNYETEDDANP